jgi:hypothetical protein
MSFFKRMDLLQGFVDVGGGDGDLTQASTCSTPMDETRAGTDLTDFLRLVRPEWRRPSKKGGLSNLERVVAKLRDIGVCDLDELRRRASEKHLNDDLVKNGHLRLSNETLDSIEKLSQFFLRIERGAKLPCVRQIGTLSPVPGLLVKTPASRPRTAGPEAGIQRRHGRRQPQKRPESAPCRRSYDRPLKLRCSGNEYLAQSTGKGTLLGGALKGSAGPGDRVARRDTLVETVPTVPLHSRSEALVQTVSSKHRRPASWETSTSADLLLQCEDMAREQEVLRERDRLRRLAAVRDSSMRKHIAGNVERHMREDAQSGLRDELRADKYCAGIRKDLAYMSQTRRGMALELCSVLPAAAPLRKVLRNLDTE